MRALDRLGKRAPTMQLALRLLADGAEIVETGCAYTPDDWSGAGLSTVVFGAWAADHDGTVRTVDIDHDHLNACRRLTAAYRECVFYEEADSVIFLDSLPAASIDLLYLDSLDYPYGALLDLYGGKTDLNAAITTLAALPEAEVVARHGTIIAASQEHCEREITAALPALHARSVVLIDDAGLPGGGKARLARRVLAGAGWTCRLEGYQILWTKP